MCGRVRATFIATKAAEAFAARLKSLWTPSSNVAPTQQVLALLRDAEGLVVESFRWGLIPSWASDRKIANKTFNARAETIAEKPSFRSAFRSRRCAILVDAFYEWAAVDGVRVPHAFKVADQDVFCLAGLWDEWTSPEGEILRTCTIVTTTANPDTKSFHERMPVILDAKSLEVWLDPKSPPPALHAVLVPFGGMLSITPTRLEPPPKDRLF